MSLSFFCWIVYSSLVYPSISYLLYVSYFMNYYNNYLDLPPPSSSVSSTLKSTIKSPGRKKRRSNWRGFHPKNSNTKYRVEKASGTLQDIVFRRPPPGSGLVLQRVQWSSPSMQRPHARYKLLPDLAKIQARERNFFDAMYKKL